MSTDHGGYAFPSKSKRWRATGANLAADPNHPYENQERHPGMTLRQWYAGKALAGMAPTPAGPMGAQGVEGYRQQYQGTAQVLAAVAFAIADAMIAEGNKP